MFYVYIFLVIAGVLIVISIPLGIIGDKIRNKNLEKIFGGRQELNERDFYERYFESQGVPFFIIKKIREILEEVLDADLSRLSAEDDFSKNLSFFFEDDSAADIEITERIEEEFEIKLSESDIASVENWSINTIVDLVWRKVREKNEFSNQ
jgi:acyl carrier protein